MPSVISLLLDGLMDKPLLLDFRYVKPVTPGKGDVGLCANCSTQSARWSIGMDPNRHISCAYCFLYVSSWGQENAVHIRELVQAIEKSMGSSISCDGIVFPEEADRILQAIVLTSAVKKARSTRAR